MLSLVAAVMGIALVPITSRMISFKVSSVARLGILRQTKTPSRRSGTTRRRFGTCFVTLFDSLPNSQPRIRRKGTNP